MENRWISIGLWIFFLFSGLIFTFYVPPFQKNDESAHFFRTVAVSKGQFSCEKGYFLIDKSWGNYYSDYQLDTVLKGKNFDLKLFDFGKIRKDEFQNQKIGSLCKLSPLGYLPNTVGILVGQLVTNKALPIFYAGRLGGLLFFILLFIYSLRSIKPEFKIGLWLFGLTPMVMNMVTAFSYDTVILSLTPLIFCVFVNKIFGYNKSKIPDWMGWLGVVIISVIKIVYLPILGILFLTGIKESKIKSNLLLVVSIGLTYFLMTFFNRVDVVNNYSIFGNPALQRRLIMADPVYYLGVLGNTLIEGWIRYYQGMVGIFGWSNTFMANITTYVIYLLGIILVVGKISSQVAKKVSLKLSLGIIFLLFTSLVGIMTAMYLMSSVVAADRIEGVQGRYFLPLLPFFIFVMARFWYEIKKNRWIQVIAVGLLMMFIMVSSVVGIYRKYYDPGKFSTLKIVDKPITSLLENKVKKEWFVVDKDYKFITTVEKDKYIVGVEIGLGSREKAVAIPYRVEIRDRECKNIIRYWYLRQFDIQGVENYKQVFEPFLSKDEQLCMVVKPMTLGINYKDSFLSMEKLNGLENWQWIYEDKDAYLKQ